MDAIERAMQSVKLLGELANFVGGDLQDLDPDFAETQPTKITHVEFLLNGHFRVCGEDYQCMLDLNHGTMIQAKHNDPQRWVTVSGRHGRFRFRGPLLSEAERRSPAHG